MNTRTFVSAAVWLMLAGGCAGDGCSCVGQIPGGFAPEDRVSGSLQIRVSETGLNTLSQNAGDLVTGIIGDLVFEVPPACSGNPTICCNGGSPAPQCGPVEVDLANYPGAQPRLALAPRQGESRTTVTARARVKLQNPLPFDYSLTGECEIASYDSTASGSPDVRVDTEVTFTVDGVSDNTYLEFGDLQIEQFDCGDLEIDGGFLCETADFLCPIIKGFLIDPLEGAIGDALRGAMCKTCPSGDVAECGAFADSCTGGVCMRGDTCIQELGFSGRLFGESLLADVSPATRGAVDIYEVTGGFAHTDNGGITLGGLTGAAPAGRTRDRCGPPATQPALDPVSLSPTFLANAHPDTGAPFDFAVGIHQSHIDHLAWSAYEGGLLCMDLTTETVALLTTNTVGLLMPSIVDLLAGENAQLVLGLRPQSPPQIALGRGTFTGPGMPGMIDEPLFDVSFSGLELDLFAQIEERFVRIMTVQTDVRLPISLEVTETGELQPVLGETEGAFHNVVVKNSEALLESPDELANKFPAILDFALPLLSSSLGSFALPALGNVRLDIQPGGITSVDDNAYLALFGDFVVVGPEAIAAGARSRPAPVTTLASISALHVPDASYFMVDAFDPAQRPYVELALGGTGADGGTPALEWSLRLDGGMWSPFVRTPQVRVARRALWLQARHRIDVRAREVGRPATTDPDPATVEFVVDVMPPRVVLAEPVAGEPVLLATDNVSEGRLQARYRVAGGAWLDTSIPARLDLAAALPTANAGGDDRARARRTTGPVVVEVWDEAGNRTQKTLTLGDAPIGAAAPIAGCSAAGGGASWPALVLIALGLLGLLRVRRRWPSSAHAAIAVVLAAAVGPGCNCGAAVDDGPCTDDILPGMVGRHASLAASGDRVVIAAYEEKFGDLVVVDVNRDGAPGYPRVVDGLPENADPTYADCAYRRGFVPAGPNVGAYTSVALAGSDARIAYQDIDRRTLEFASESGGSFAVHTVDPGDGGRAGLYNSLAIGPDGAPAIAYLATGVPDATGVLYSQLRFVQANSADPAGPDDWTMTVVEQVEIACAGLCGESASCVLDGEVSRCAADTADCAADCGDDTCVDGACLPAVANPPAYDLPAGTGLFAQLGYLPDRRPVIVYHDRAAGALVMQLGGDSWTRVELDTEPGRWPSMVIDPGGTVHVAYQDASSRTLKYTTWTDGDTGAIEIVDDGVRSEPRVHAVGASTALFVAPSGQLAVAYQDSLVGDLLVARREGTTWRREDLATGPQLYGFFVDAAHGESASWIASFFYDRSSTIPGGLRVDQLR